jgi:hypothetical protein
VLLYDAKYLVGRRLSSRLRALDTQKCAEPGGLLSKSDEAADCADSAKPLA